MARIESSRVLPHPPERVFAFLSDLHNHWQLANSFISVDGVQDGGGRIVIRGPFGISREARTELVEAVPSRLLRGRAQVGGTAGAVEWVIEPDGGGSNVALSAEAVRATVPDRLLLTLGGRRWLRRRFERVLETLERRLD